MTQMKMAESILFQLQQQKLDSGPLYYSQAVETSLRAPPLGYIVHSHNIKNKYWHKRNEPDPIDYTSLHDSLERVFSKPLFCCGGSLTSNEMDKFVLVVKPSTSEEDKDNWKEFDLAKGIDVEELLKYCTPASFGDLKEMKTLIDSDVRLANAVESERFKIGFRLERNASVVRPSVPGRAYIEKHIEDVLTPGRTVNFDHYKLNVYSKGGFFKPHVDNPSGEDMIGTLVICLPSSHKGGELCVNHDGVQHSFDFSSHSEDASRIQWAAFYSNCIHEVKPVLEGNRVTITYNIIQLKDLKSRYRSTIKWEPPPAVDETFETSVSSPSLTTETLNNVDNELEKIRKQKSTTGSPSKIGFFLKHKYIPNGLQQSMLKGEDKALFDFLVGKQWKCELKNVLSRYQTEVIYLDGEDAELDEWHQVYEFNLLPPTAYASYDTDSALYGRYRTKVQFKFRKWRFGIPFIDAYRKESDTQQLRNNEGHGAWVGNEVDAVGVDKIYLESVIIVHL